MAKIVFCSLLFLTLFGEMIPEKVLICGICKDIQKAVWNTRQFSEYLGKQFLDYRVIIYENNSQDKTPDLLQEWAEKNKKVIFLSEYLSGGQLKRRSEMKVKNRMDILARARNIVLERAMSPEYDDYKYVVWADLDFREMWDVEELKNIILRPEQEWDAVFGYGEYDLFAFRSVEAPIGFEFLGDLYWRNLDFIREKFKLKKTDPWKKVYSAFGGIGIYKRESLRGCQYSGVITRDTELLFLQIPLKGALLWKDYQALLEREEIVDLKKEQLLEKDHRAPIGVRLHPPRGMGQIVWFSAVDETTLPVICEHIPLHASMILKGRDRLFVDPRLYSNHPPR